MAPILTSDALWLEAAFLADSHTLFTRLSAEVAWDDRIRARKVASFGVPYNYSGTVWPAAPFPDTLLPVLTGVSIRLGYEPNNCLANFYADGGASMGYHSDETEDLEPGTGIAVLSLGAERDISFRSQQDKRVVERLPLPSGSLLFMSASMQAEWKHAILVTDGVNSGRISLTFRRMRGGNAPAS